MPVEERTILEYFENFGLEPGVAFQTVKEAYRRMMKEFHPDHFKEGTAAYDMAHQKAIELNASFESLENFYAEYPEGKLPEPEKNPEEEPPEQAPPEEQAAPHSPADEDDWQVWQQRQQNRWEKELEEWIARQDEARKQKLAVRESGSKASMVNKAKTFSVITLALMWLAIFTGSLISFFGFFLVILSTGAVSVVFFSKTANKKLNEWIGRPEEKG